MNRRGFFTLLLGAGLGPWAARLRAQCPRPCLLIQASPLAGFQYHQGERLWPQFQPGQPLTLAREPANPHDPRAVRVDWRGHKLGYLPRLENTAVSQMLDRGEPLTARILQLRDARDPWARVRVAVELSMDKA